MGDTAPGASSARAESGVYTALYGRVQQYDRNAHPIDGYCLVRNRTAHTWALTVTGTVLKEGPLPSAAAGGQPAWHSLSLHFAGTTIGAALDGQALATVVDSTYSRGMATLGCGWHQAYFDNFEASPTSA